MDEQLSVPDSVVEKMVEEIAGLREALRWCRYKMVRVGDRMAADGYHRQEITEALAVGISIADRALHGGPDGNQG